MNSRQLHWILSNDKVTSRNCKGIHALDEIEHIKQISFPSAYVFNLDPSYKPGVHWVAAYIDRKGLPEYFDSFGRPPQEKSKTFCAPMQKAGTTIMSLFKNFILPHVDNLLCFIFIKDVLV